MAIMNFSHQSSMTKTLIHELGHFYGAPDHYDIGGEPSTDELNAQNGGNKFNRNCIYGENKEDSLVLDNFTICAGCKEIIRSNQQNYLHREQS